MSNPEPASQVAGPPSLSYAAMLRYSTRRERQATALGCLAAIATGAMTPIYAIMFGRLLNAFFADELEAEIRRTALAIVGVAAAAFACGTVQVSCLMWAGARQANRVRQLYLASLLSQDMPFFDTAAQGASGLVHALREEASQLQEALSDKLGAFVQGLACFVGGMIVAFARGWDLSLVVLAAIPALVIIGAVCGIFTAKLQAQASRAYGRAGAIAFEAVGHIRTVAAFGQEEGSLKGYAAALAEPTRVGEWQGVLAGFTLGATHLVFYCAYALSLWYGARRVAGGALDGGRVITVLMACVLGGFSLGQAMPHLAIFQRGRAAAAMLFAVIERKPQLGSEEDMAAAEFAARCSLAPASCSPLAAGAPGLHAAPPAAGCLDAIAEDAAAEAAGDAAASATAVAAGQVDGSIAAMRPSAAASGALVPAVASSHPVMPAGGCRGELELARVSFAYPARPQRSIIRNLSLVFPAGKTSALVGESGCGKSTIVQLLLRLYDPSSGAVLLDGRDVRTLPLRWLRAQVGLVSQQPVLFASTIFENIALTTGATMEQVVQASIAANAHSFIEKLPNGYDTVVGEQGSNLSGGQRQRIAIARAVLLNPRILLLDEATSALDPACERAVQEALEALMPGRTCIAVAHRLSTVANADAVHVLRRGRVVETGTHRELLEKGGYYAQLAARQALHLESRPGSVAAVEGQASCAAGAVGAAGAVVTVSVVAAGTSAGAKGEKAASSGGGKGGAVSAVKRLRDSILHRGSVRISVIPQRLKDKIAAQKRAEEGAHEEAAAQLPSPFRRLAQLNRPEWKYGAAGLVCACIAGLQMPGFSLALSEVMSNMWDPYPPNIRTAGVTWALVFICIGCAAFLLETVQGWCFGVMGQRLATRVRILLLQSLLHQDIPFFDRHENSTAAMLSTLASDAVAVRGVVGDRLGHLATIAACVVGSYAIALKSSWSVTLVVSAALPLLVGAHAVLARLNFGVERSGREAAAGADGVAAEAVGAIATVAAFNMQPAYVALYRARLAASTSTRTAVTSGLGFGFSQFMLMAISALAFWYGGTQVAAGRIDFRQLLTAFFAVFYAAFGVAQAGGAFPDIVRAADAVRNVFRVLDHCPPSARVGANLELEGGVELRRVAFAYPHRPERLVLKEFNLVVPQGTSCALVGESGHGKSTILALLERFYEPLEGTVLIDGINIRSLNLRCLRRQLALVSQDPVVFSASVYDNLVLSSGATPHQVIEAARMAQALDFIQALPEGFSTRLGDGGSRLSGGQLQRLALARALLHQPRVLLLDEPTSALDSQTEAQVLTALETAMVGRTTLMVAHRLPTVQRCTSIAAIYRGHVLEQGSHEELLAKDGYYRHLWDAAQGN
ncbi:hypothetical protein ABPG75_009524 [Micractinium tetrahymenae]